MLLSNENRKVKQKNTQIMTTTISPKPRKTKEHILPSFKVKNATHK